MEIGANTVARTSTFLDSIRTQAGSNIDVSPRLCFERFICPRMFENEPRLRLEIVEAINSSSSELMVIKGLICGREILSEMDHSIE